MIGISSTIPGPISYKIFVRLLSPIGILDQVYIAKRKVYMATDSIRNAGREDSQASYFHSAANQMAVLANKNAKNESRITKQIKTICHALIFFNCPSL